MNKKAPGSVLFQSVFMDVFVKKIGRSAHLNGTENGFPRFAFIFFCKFVLPDRLKFVAHFIRERTWGGQRRAQIFPRIICRKNFQRRRQREFRFFKWQWQIVQSHFSNSSIFRYFLLFLSPCNHRAYQKNNQNADSLVRNNMPKERKFHRC